MIGRQQLIIDANDFVRGMASDDNIADGGFSPDTDAVNLIAKPGVLYAPAGVTNKSANLTGNPIAHTPSSVLSRNGFLLASDGKIMSIDANQDLAASSALAGDWVEGTSDIVHFIDKLYATSANDIARMETDLTGGDHDWWSDTLGKGILVNGARHPMVIYQDRLWVADRNALHQIINSSTGNKDVLLLNSHHEITALGVDQSSGKMIIATTQGPNYSGTVASGNFIFLYDGTSSTYTREYRVDGMVTGFRNVGGVTYVAYGQKLGYWNGAGITYLRKLKNVTLAGADLAYKHHLTNIENTLYVIDGTQVLAYGEVLPGRKVFYYAQKNNVNTNKYKLICPVGNNKLGLGFATNRFYTFDTVSVADNGSMSFLSKRYDFPRPIFLRSAYIEYADAIPNNDDNRTLFVRSEDLAVSGFQITSSLKNSSGASVNFIDNIIGFAQNKVRSFSLRYQTLSTNIGLRRIIIYYDYAE